MSTRYTSSQVEKLSKVIKELNELSTFLLRNENDHILNKSAGYGRAQKKYDSLIPELETLIDSLNQKIKTSNPYRLPEELLTTERMIESTYFENN